MPDRATYPGLRDRHVLVTGGATGIGAAIVRAFAAQGSRVTVLDIDRPGGEALADVTGALFLLCDVTDTPALRAACALAEDRQGPVRALVANAANDRRHDAATLSPDDWDASLAINLRHAFFAAQAVLPGMEAAGGGAVVNLSSVAWMLGVADLVPYSAAKAGLVGLTRSLAAAVGPRGVRVNAVLPGAVMTERQMRLWHTPESRAALVARQSIPADVLEDDIADAVLFLASDASRMITRQCLIVDGGLS